MTRKIPLLTLTLLLACGAWLAACSSSDDTPTNPGGGGDTTAPQVAASNPDPGDTGVGQSQTITVAFNEAMDPTSDDGQISLSVGTVTTTTWSDDQTLEIDHTAWAEGAHVTVTVGTGLADAAGNTLATAYNFDFYVFSSALSLLETNPANGATGVNRSANIQMLFSQDIMSGSVAGNVTITDNTKAVLPYTSQVDGSAVTLMPEGTLPADTQITVTVGAGLLSQLETPLGTEASFSFTTSADVDVTPPTVLSVSPSSGSTFAADVGVFRITFSEPMDPSYFNPSAWNAEFALVMEQSQTSPIWSQDFTTVTVALPSPLPAGLPCEITFSTLTDANGVTQTTPWTWEGTVAGTADYYPTADGTEYIFDVYWARGTIGNETPQYEDSGMKYEMIAVQGDGTFRVVRYDDAFVTPSGDYEAFRRLSSRIEWVGFANSDSSGVHVNSFDSPLTILPLPMAAGTWTDNTTVTIPGEGAYTATLNGTVAGPMDIPIADAGSQEIFFKNAFRVIRILDVQVGGSPAFVETDTIWYSPTLGPVQHSSYEEDANANEWQLEQTWRVFGSGK